MLHHAVSILAWRCSVSCPARSAQRRRLRPRTTCGTASATVTCRPTSEVPHPRAPMPITPLSLKEEAVPVTVQAFCKLLDEKQRLWLTI